MRVRASQGPLPRSLSCQNANLTKFSNQPLDQSQLKKELLKSRRRLRCARPSPVVSDTTNASHPAPHPQPAPHSRPLPLSAVLSPYPAPSLPVDFILSRPPLSFRPTITLSRFPERSLCPHRFSINEHLYYSCLGAWLGVIIADPDRP